MKIKIAKLQGIFLKWENEYSVDKWKLKGIHVWPIIKVIIYFNLYRNYASSSNNTKDKIKWVTAFKRKLKKGVKYLYGVYYLLLLQLKKSDYIFSGAPSHRITWKGKKFNRYFDPIQDYIADTEKNSYLLEYGRVDLNKVYNQKRVIDLTRLHLVFRRRKNKSKNDKLWNDIKFKSFLKNVEDVTGIKREVLESQLDNKTNSILDWANLYEYFFRKTEAKYAFGLCYYNDAMYGLNLAANKLNIRAVDMQHGLQGYLHPAYFFSKVPVEGFNILPTDFWVWDKASYRNIEKWDYNSPHKVIMGGNPWIDYLKINGNMNFDINDSRPLILFTLQPLEPLFSDYLVELIEKSRQKYNWWIRLHPRMKDCEVRQVRKALSSRGLLEFVNIEMATNLPLPFILYNCRLHISKSSGAIAEAALMDRYSLIIDEVGVNSYQDLISSGKAFNCLTKDPDDFLNLMGSVLKLEKTNTKKESNNGYFQIIDKFNLE